MTPAQFKSTAQKRWGKSWRKELILTIAPYCRTDIKQLSGYPYSRSYQAAECRVSRYLTGKTAIPEWVSVLVKNSLK